MNTNTKDLLQAGGLGIVVAVILVVVTFFIADAANGPLLVTPPGGDGVEELSVAPAIFGTVVGGLVGVGLALVARRLPKPDLTFVGICIVGLVAYGIFAITASETTSAGLWLNVMHMAAAIPIVGSLRQWLKTGSHPKAPVVP